MKKNIKKIVIIITALGLIIGLGAVATWANNSSLHQYFACAGFYQNDGDTPNYGCTNTSMHEWAAQHRMFARGGHHGSGDHGTGHNGTGDHGAGHNGTGHGHDNSGSGDGADNS